MGLVVFGTIFAVIGTLIAVFRRNSSSAWTVGGLRLARDTIGGVLVALLGVGLVIGGVIETLNK